MRYTRRLTLLLCLAALGVMAIAASSASAATVLCKANETPCSKANVKPAGSYIPTIADSEFAEGTKFAIGSWTCSHIVWGGRTTSEAGSPLPLQTESWMSPTTCTPGIWGNTCSEAVSSQPPATVVATGSGNGTVTFGTSSKHMSFEFTCTPYNSTPITCKWGSASLPMQFNASTQRLTGEKVLVTLEERSGELSPYACGEIGSTKSLNATLETYGGGVYITTF